MDVPYPYDAIEHSKQGGMEVDPNHEAQTQKQVDDRPYKYETGQYQSEPASAIPYSYQSRTTEIQDGRRICGFRAVTFWLICAIIFLVIAGAVGGGVGGTIAVKNATTNANAANAAANAAAASSASSQASPTACSLSTSSSSASTTSASTSASTASITSTVWGPIPTSAAFSNCPAINGGTYNTTTGVVAFKVFCDHDLPFSDMLYIMTSTFGLCMEACKSWNSQGKGAGGANVTCAAVAFLPQWVFGQEAQGSTAGIPADCVLKSIGDESKVFASSKGVHIGLLV